MNILLIHDASALEFKIIHQKITDNFMYDKSIDFTNTSLHKIIC